jgi:hypothetical protein
LTTVQPECGSGDGHSETSGVSMTIGVIPSTSNALSKSLSKFFDTKTRT